MRGVILASQRGLIAAVLVALAAGCATDHARVTHGRRPAVAAPTRVARAGARTSGLPGIYLGAMAGPWYGPSVRPASVLLGADWTIESLRWTTWSQRRARGHGFYDACTGPAGEPPCDRFRFWAAITATDVRRHGGRRYFAVMKLAGSRGRVVRLVMNTKFGWWQRRPAA